MQVLSAIVALLLITLGLLAIYETQRFFRRFKAIETRLAYDMGPVTAAAILPPSPDEIALLFAAALMCKSGDTMSAEAAVMNAWWAVPHFYTGRQEYVDKIAPTMFGVAKAEVVEPVRRPGYDEAVALLDREAYRV